MAVSVDGVCDVTSASSCCLDHTTCDRCRDDVWTSQLPPSIFIFKNGTVFRKQLLSNTYSPRGLCNLCLFALRINRGDIYCSIYRPAILLRANGNGNCLITAVVSRFIERHTAVTSAGTSDRVSNESFSDQTDVSSDIGGNFNNRTVSVSVCCGSDYVASGYVAIFRQVTTNLKRTYSISKRL